MAGNLQHVHAPMTVRPDQSRLIEQAVAALQAEAINFGQRFIKDGNVRAGYLAETKRYSDQLLSEVRAGRIAPQAAAQQAQEMRNAIMDAARIGSSDIGRAQAQALKAQGKGLNAVEDVYARRLFQADFARFFDWLSK